MNDWTEAWADKVIAVNLVGFPDTGPNEPVERGNCFTVRVGGREMRVINFGAENLEKLLALGLSWPVRCVTVYGVAAIHDHRIGERWYNQEWCELCCPRELLPIP